MQVSLEELAMLLGQRDIEIYALQKRIEVLEKQLQRQQEKQEKTA